MSIENLAHERPEDAYPECREAVALCELVTESEIAELRDVPLNAIIVSMIVEADERGWTRHAHQMASPQFRQYLAAKLGLV